jgi:hypothetical protein
MKLCTLYSITTNQAAIAALFRVMNRAGRIPDYPAPCATQVASARCAEDATAAITGGPPFTIFATPSPRIGGAG